MPGIGDVRVNLIADVAKFVENVRKGSLSLTAFARSAEMTVKKIDTYLGSLATKATLRLTLPLTAFAATAIKAADPTGRVANEIQRLGLQAQKALEPLGSVLIDLFDRAQPYLQRAAGAIQLLADKFAALPSSTQEMIIGIAAAAAAIGPLAFGFGAITTLLKPVATGFRIVTGVLSTATSAVFGFARKSIVAVNEWALSWWKNSEKVGTAIGLTLRNITLLGTALTFFEAGRYLYDEFKWIQDAAALVIKKISDDVAYLKFLVLVTADAVHNVIDEVLTFGQHRVGEVLHGVYQTLLEIPDGLRMVSDETMQQLSRLEIAWSNAEDSFDFTAKLKERRDELDRTLEHNAAVAIETGKLIEQEFGGKTRKGLDPFQFLIRDVARLGEFANDSVASLQRLKDEGLSGVDDWYQKMVGLSQELLAAAPAPFVQTKAEAKAAADQLEKLNKYTSDLAEKAKQIRFEVDPQAKLEDAIHNVRLLQSDLELLGMGGLLPDSTMNAYIAKLMEDLDKLREKADKTFRKQMGDAVSGFSSQASSSIANMVMDGKAKLKELGDAFMRMALTAGFQNAVFGPAFSAIGSWISGKPAAPAASGIGVQSAHGNAFMNGLKLNAFGSGTVLNSPITFPMRNGLGLAGEKGPEGIFPLTRIGQDLGVKATPSPVVININDHRQMGSDVQVSESVTPGGHRQIDILIADTVDRRLASGRFDGTLNRVFGVRRRGV